MRIDTAKRIRTAVEHAREKHPNFRRTTRGKLAVLLEEVWEVVWAALFQGPQRTREELMDVAAVVVRWWEGD